MPTSTPDPGRVDSPIAHRELVLPTGQLVGSFEPGSSAWHAARSHGIGGSEIAAVLGLSPFESAFSLWHRKCGLIAPVQETDVMYWGRALEPAICDEYARRRPGQIIVPASTYQGTGRPWQIVNPDRFAILPDGTVEVVEAKTSRDADGWGAEGTGAVPIYYRAQVRWYLDALGLRTARIAVLISGSDYREYVVEHDPADAALMRDRADSFMTSVRNGFRPDIDGHSATYQAVKELPEGLDSVDVEITPQLRDRYWSALDACKAAEEEKRHAAGLILDRIDTGRRAVVGRQKVATRTVRGSHTHSLQPARNRGTAA